MNSLNISINLLTIVCLSLLISACTSSTSPEMDDDPVDMEVTTLTLDNDGANAYVLIDIDGEGASGEAGESNVDIELEPGQRFTFENRAGASSHPLAFRNSDGDDLFRQGSDSGSFADDEEVNVVQEDDSISFTLTEELAQEIAIYICVFHPSMRGSIEIR